MTDENKIKGTIRPFGPLILDGNASRPVDYVTLLKPADLTTHNLKMLESLYEMHRMHFGDGGRKLSHFIRVLGLNEERSDTQHAITMVSRGDEPIAMSDYITIISPDGLGAHGTISTPYTSITKSWRKSSGNNENVGLKLRNIRHEAANKFIRSKKQMAPTSAPIIVLFNEVEDSLLLTLGEHRKTINDAETNAIVRQLHWHKIGYGAIDLPFYTELASIDGAPSCNHYALQAWIVGQSAHQPFGPAIPSSLLAHHVTTQASEQRLHGGDPNDDPDHLEVMKHIMAKEMHLPRDRTEELLPLLPKLENILALRNPTLENMQFKKLLALGYGS